MKKRLKKAKQMFCIAAMLFALSGCQYSGPFLALTGQTSVITQSMNLEQVREAVGSGVDLERMGTELILARWSEIPYTVIPEYLIQAGADIDQPDPQGYTLLMYACGLDKQLLAQEDFLELFLSYGADVDHCTEDGLTALDIAAGAGKLKTVQRLLACGATVTEETWARSLPGFEEQGDYARYQIARILLERLGGTVHSPSEEDQLWIMALNGDSEQVRQLLSTAERDEVLSSALPVCISAFCGPDALAAVLPSDASLERYAYMLYVAAACGNTEIVAYLLEHHEFPYQTMLTGALRNALVNGEEETARLLYEKGAVLDIPGQSTAEEVFYDVAAGGRTECVALMLQNGLDLTEDVVYQAVTKAIDAGESGFVKFLVEELKADPNARIDNSTTAIGYAAFRGDLDLVKWLYDHGARVDGAVSPLERAVERNHLDVVRYLHEECGANINGITRYSDGSGGSALEAAVSYGYLDILKYLAEQGADLDWTVTVFSADMSSKEEISLLDYAKRQGSERVTAYLEECLKSDRTIVS